MFSHFKLSIPFDPQQISSAMNAKGPTAPLKKWNRWEWEDDEFLKALTF